MWTWIVAIAWMYVALMMAMAEATNPQGSVLGALITFLLYGVGPLALVLYLMGTSARRKARHAAEATEAAGAARVPAGNSDQGDASRLPSGDAVAPVREEP